MENKSLDHWLTARSLDENPGNTNDVIFHYEEALRLGELSSIGKLTSHLRLGQLYHSLNTLPASMKHFEVVFHDDQNLSLIEEENARMAIINEFYAGISKLYVSFAREIKEKEGLNEAIKFLQDKIALLSDKCPPMPYLELGGYYALNGEDLEKSEEIFKKGIAAPTYDSDLERLGALNARDVLNQTSSETMNSLDTSMEFQWFEYLKGLSQRDPDRCLKVLPLYEDAKEIRKNDPVASFIKGIAYLKKAIDLSPNFGQDQWSEESLDFLEKALIELNNSHLTENVLNNSTEFKIGGFDAAAISIEKFRPGRVQQLLGKTKLRYFGEDRVFYDKRHASDDEINLFANIFFNCHSIVRLAYIQCSKTDDSGRRFIRVGLFEEASPLNDLGEPNEPKAIIDIYDDGEVSVVAVATEQTKASIDKTPRPSKRRTAAIIIGIILICFFSWFIIRSWYGSDTHTFSDGYIIRYSSEDNIVSIFDKDPAVSGCNESTKEVNTLKTINKKNRTINNKKESIIELMLYSKKTGLKDYWIIQEKLASKDRQKLKGFLKKGANYLATLRKCGSGGFPTIEGIELQNK